MRSIQSIFTFVSKLSFNKLPFLKEWLREVENQEKDIIKLLKVSQLF